MTAQQLIRLYPPGWKNRYGDEFVAMVGGDRLTVQQVIDIVSGAIDAWLSSDARRAGAAAPAGAQQGGTMPAFAFMCVDRKARYSPRDAAIGGFVIILASALFAGLEFLARRAGLAVTSAFLHIAAVPAALTLSMPFWVLKGQSRRVQFAVVAVTLAVAVLVTLV
jgi:hypothetical protein